ncbi:MAG: outer membrane lipoprotein carrier protein LolA [Alphaproteobacteria bacterium]|nr:outer membrane lipoprotein carrier protein LolA [Alphaproteobacteria bacterium]
MKKLILTFCTAVIFMAPAYAAVTKKTFTATDKAAIERVEDYLSDISTIVADFVQIAPDGGMADGKFYLSRPGKMRWQYNPPTPILMVADGKFLIFYDYELDQTSYIPLQETLAGFLARDSVKFGSDVIVTNVTHGEGSLRLSVVQKARPDDGKLTLEFADNPLQLRNMKVVDATGQETTVSLANARYGQKLDKELFVFEDKSTAPRIGKSGKTGIQR